MDTSSIKSLLLVGSPDFWPALRTFSEQASEFEELITLSALRRKALSRGLTPPGGGGAQLRLALLGGCSLYPLHEVLSHLLATAGIDCELFLGDYDNYVAEIMEADSALYEFGPQIILLLPGVQRCRHSGSITDPADLVQTAAAAAAGQLIALCHTINQRTSAEVILANFMLPSGHDLGALRSRVPASDWSFRKRVNIELGAHAPSFVHICDLEFLTNRRGALTAEDARGWFESKQLLSPPMLVDVCRELEHLISGLRKPHKKVLALDLDNTLWGGVVADEGMEGIEIGDTSPRGEAFKAFQKYIAQLKDRGVLLAVCSKNDQARAMEPFEKHPEMVLRTADFVSFKANWEPKSDNLHQIAAELRLGLDSFVFVDDNPAEIDIVRQFAPEVTTILLGADPADYVQQLQDCRLFEPHSITSEDAQRTGQYRAEAGRQSLLMSATDMDAYLESLGMKAVIREFTPVDAPRLSQLINKSNQFNLTSRRRTEAEILALIDRPDHIGIGVRLEDRFGDHGLISIVIGRVIMETLEIDTWLMSCRVLKRQVEEMVLNELARRALARGCSMIEGIYIATPKNEMVRDFFPRMGFNSRAVTEERGEYTLDLSNYSTRTTRINICPSPYEPA